MGNIQSISEIRNLWLGTEEKPKKKIDEKDPESIPEPNAAEKNLKIAKLVRIISLKFLREESTTFFT
jgi:hypothetical protein